MKVCESGHIKIVHEGNICPLCRLTKHNLIVHQFVESKEINLVEKLIEYQEKRRLAPCINKGCCSFSKSGNSGCGEKNNLETVIKCGGYIPKEDI
jgi:hypothetical protein